MSGADFLARFPDGTGDPITSVSPNATYAVHKPTAHPVYENFRVKAFAELLHGEISHISPIRTSSTTHPTHPTLANSTFLTLGSDTSLSLHPRPLIHSFASLLYFYSTPPILPTPIILCTPESPYRSFAVVLSTSSSQTSVLLPPQLFQVCKVRVA